MSKRAKKSELALPKYEAWVTITTTYRVSTPRLAETSRVVEKAELARLEKHEGIPADYVLDSEYTEVAACLASSQPAPMPQAEKSRGREPCPKCAKPPAVMRKAVEFTYQLWTPEQAELIPRSALSSKVYWTVRLGRLALTVDGGWAYWAQATRLGEKKFLKFIRQQRFVDFEEAVRVATEVFGQEPEHVEEMRWHARQFEKGTKKKLPTTEKIDGPQ